MSKYGIITYHSAYNYGSVFQAYATQWALDKIGIKAEVINYRPEEQNYFYKKLYRFKYGVKTAVIIKIKRRTI